MNAEAIFIRALETSSETECQAYLSQVCAGNSELRARVERLLQAHHRPDPFLDLSPQCLVVAGRTDEFDGFLGQTIGPYKLLELIGEGGMGLVFMAEQQNPVKRRVALKVIKPGLDTRQVIARFEGERQALALMDHPGIARIFDMGATERGHPYFVMELVRGIPITDYCDQARLKPRERLDLFVTVCQAVQHAHTKGIVHRDLKPANILVTMHDDKAIPKIIDFGVAKALGEPLVDRTMFTNFLQMIGTPVYMSPEQAQLSSLDVDTRSDVYSLGVLLYELLTGTVPFKRERLRRADFDELRRIIRDEEPPRPSARVATLDAVSLSTIAENRAVDLRNYIPTLRGDLDWIVMKALEKDRTRRYESAGALAADIQRFLADEPVRARPPSAGYRLRKLLRRQRHALTTVGIVTAALMTGLISAAVVVVVKDREGREIARVRVPDGGSLTITNEAKSAVSDPASSKSLRDKPALSGLIQSPGEFAGIGRWQLITRRSRIFPQHYGKLAWSPDNRFLALGEANYVRVYSVPELQLVHIMAGHTNRVIAVDWSPDGKQIASTSSDNSIRLWDAKSGIPGPVLVGHLDHVHGVAWHPDSRRLASASRDTAVRVWTNAGTTGPVFYGHSQAVNAVAWNRDGTLLASASEGDGIRVWDADGKAKAVIPHDIWLRSVAWSPDGSQLLAAQFAPGVVKIWNLDGSVRNTLTDHSFHVVDAAWSPDGTMFASASWDGTTRLSNADGTPGPILRGGWAFCQMEFGCEMDRHSRRGWHNTTLAPGWTARPLAAWILGKCSE